MWKAVENVNELWIDGRKVFVGVVKYQKNSPRVAGTSRSLTVSQGKVTEGKFKPLDETEIPRSIRDDRSYKDVLLSSSTQKCHSEQMGIRDDSFDKGRGKKNIWEMPHSKFKLGFEIHIASWGYIWNACVVTFKSEELMKEAWVSKSEELWFWFDQLAPMLNEGGVPMAYCLVELYGVPLLCWQENFLEKLAGRGGSMEEEEDDNTQFSDMPGPVRLVEEARQKVDIWIDQGASAGFGVAGGESSIKLDRDLIPRGYHSDFLEAADFTEGDRNGDFNAYLIEEEKEGLTQNRNSMEISSLFIQQTGLIDLPLIGGNFTWSSNRYYPTVVRLDRFLVNVSFSAVFSSITQLLLPKSISDHNAIIMESGVDNWGKIPFRLLNYLMSEEEFEEKITESIKKFRMDKKKVGLLSILKNTKVSIKRWSGDRKQFPRDDISALEDKIHQLENKFKQNQNSIDYGSPAELRFLRNELWRLYRIEEQIWFQKSREMWVKDGDRNSKLFYTCATIRRRRNSLNAINVEGEIIKDPVLIKSAVREHFYKAYNCSSTLEVEDIKLNFSRISMEQSLMLEKEFTEDEIWETINSCNSNKAPGPDGFLWGGGVEVKKIHWIKWSTVCSGKSVGGLGVFELNYMNRALLGKWSWRFANDKESVWKKVICCKYNLDVRSLLFKDKLPAHASWIWKSVVQNHFKEDQFGAKFRNGLVWKGNGEGIYSVKSSVKSCYPVSTTESFWMKYIWRGLVPPRVEVFMWQDNAQSFMVAWEEMVLNSKIWSFIPGVVIWTIWKTRNDIVFDGGRNSLISDPTIGDCCSNSRLSIIKNVSWSPPPKGFIKLNVDAAVNGDWRKSGVEGILRVEDGSVMGSFREATGPGPPLLIEIMPIKKGLSFFAFIHQRAFVKDIVILLRDLNGIIRWVPRSANVKADSLAKVEEVLYSIEELKKENEDGVSILFYLKTIYPDEWTNFLERINNKPQENCLREWVSYRGQTLSRSVRGMMYYKKALELQCSMEFADSISSDDHVREKVLPDLKFTYVVSCQIYGILKHEVEEPVMEKTEGKTKKVYYSVLLKGDTNTYHEREIYRIKLPGLPTKIGEGKPENQNHAIIFTREEALQTIDMNQDNYFEEAFKMRNVLEEFPHSHGSQKPTILGLREHVFTGRVRLHYGHPDIFDRIFHITRGGISKASKTINLSEDIFAGFNSTLRLGSVTHHDYMQVGKGRDVGMNQISLFEAKVANGNGEQTLSRDVHRLGCQFDFFRMLSFYFTTVGFYFNSMVVVLVVYVFLYGRLYMVMTGLEREILEDPQIKHNNALEAPLLTQSFIQMGMLLVLPMLMEIGLEKGFRAALGNFIIMQLQLASMFFTFQLGTKAHYFGRTILHGGSKYRATGRGFVVRHAKFADNYRLYSRSHFVKASELSLLLIIYEVYGESYRNSSLYLFITFSMWFLVGSWLFAPSIFNPSGFEWKKTVNDWADWNRCMGIRGGVGIQPENSWESWWDEEQDHLRYTSIRGRVLEILLALRFFFYQFGIVYHLDIAYHSRSLLVYGLCWCAVLVILIVPKIVSVRRLQMFHMDLQLPLRMLKGLLFLIFLAIMIILFKLFGLTLSDLFASVLAFMPTGCGFILVEQACRPCLHKLLWEPMKELARAYDFMIGLVLFTPIAFLSWLPAVSEFQTRILFNQAFSRGLHISMILSGKKDGGASST
ncbi:Callose synthase 1 [Hibiscus syriacus]|uniref:Callose synthase 1 n=1 Tax=Hibiscus syriacus TaxID=106335 RepID=A0A6A2Y744_HIBSY|nr:Callose synthase 1 [Hibiscus syriacus]